MVMVFKDNGVVRTGSTSFKLTGMDLSIIMPNLATTTNHHEMESVLSLSDIQILKTLSHEGLKKLVSVHEKSTNKVFSSFLLSFRCSK